MRWGRNGRSEANFSTTISATAMCRNCRISSPRRRGRPKSNSTFAFRGYTLRLGVNYQFDGPSDATALAAVCRTRHCDIIGDFGVRAGMSTSTARN